MIESVNSQLYKTECDSVKKYSAFPGISSLILKKIFAHFSRFFTYPQDVVV